MLFALVVAAHADVLFLTQDAVIIEIETTLSILNGFIRKIVEGIGPLHCH